MAQEHLQSPCCDNRTEEYAWTRPRVHVHTQINDQLFMVLCAMNHMKSRNSLSVQITSQVAVRYLDGTAQPTLELYKGSDANRPR